MLTLFRLWSWLPLWLVHGLGTVAGWLVYAASGAYRHRFNENAARAGIGAATRRAAIGQAGRMVAELPRLWLRRSLPPCDGADQPAIASAYAAPHGALFLTPHLGCFEVAARAAALHHLSRHGPLTVMYRPARQAALRRVMEASRERPELATVPTSLAGVRQLLKALRAGRSVGLLPDQVPPDGQGVWSPFFGKPAYTMTLAARLALQSGATVCLVWGERLPWGRGYRLHSQLLAEPLSPVLEHAVAQLNAAVESVIRQCPEQYLWGYGRYKQPRQPSPEAM